MQKSHSVEHLLSETRRFSPSNNFKENAILSDTEEYTRLYNLSITDPEVFWLQQSNRLDWFEKPTLANNSIWDSKERIIENRWFEDGKLNVSYNCLDRHILAGNGSKTAFIWQGDDENESKTITYQELYDDVCRFANVLLSRGVKAGDRVCIYLSMIPELPVVVLACARIGVIHSVVFAGFSSESLCHRINDAECRYVITANEGKRGGKTIPLKALVDEAVLHCPSVETIFVVKRTEEATSMESGRDYWVHEEMSHMPPVSPPLPFPAEHPLFILYTSGSTGKPKGVVHSSGGYLLYAAMTHKYLFDSKEDDVYWCTADIGWITGHSYVIYGPLANGSTILLFEGVPSYPDYGRIWQIIDRYRVTIFYTAPTLIRTLIQYGEHYPLSYKLDSLRLLGTVGEPINPEAWMWYYEVVGKGKCPIVDTWWQTETGGILLSAFPGVHTLKPGSANRPFFGIEPIVLNDDATECQSNEGGSLCMKKSWPGIMRTTWGDHERYIDTYFTKFDNLYFTGDGCRIDEGGDFWLLGRIDDVVNVSGHRLSTAEIESALVSYESVAEAAVVAIPDVIKGQALYAFVTLLADVPKDETIRRELMIHVRQQIGAIAVPEKIQFTDILPKTRSGKIMRRILRKIAAGDHGDLGDVTTLADTSIVKALVEGAEQDA